ncbi:hypothetical protein ACVMIH_002433 [Bradyrhizobium sp. USDA 4503]
MTRVSYTVPANWTAGSDPTGAGKGKNPNDPNMLTTGAYGNAFELMINRQVNGDGTATDTLTYKSYIGETNGTFTATEETGSGGDPKSAYQALLVAMQANRELDASTTAQLEGAFGELQTKPQDGTSDAAVTHGGLLVRAGGPISFNRISAYENTFVTSLIGDLTTRLQHDSTS